MLKNPFRAGLAAVVALTLASMAGISVAAAPPSPQGVGVVLGGACAATPGSLHMAFTHALSTSSLSPIMTINGTLTCAGDPVLGSITFGIGGQTIAYTCAAGLATIGGTATLSAPVPSDTVSVQVVGDGTHVHMTVTGLHIVGSGEFVWSTPSAISGCPTGGTSGTDLTGTLVFTYT
jgi:hypothetical protein